MRRLRRLPQLLGEHRYGLALLALLTAAAVTGVAVVLFMRGFEGAIALRLTPERLGKWSLLVTPAVFYLSSEFIARRAPAAGGTGIPQAVFAARHMTEGNEAALSALASPLTLAAKVVCLLAAVAVGASSGREGPSVQIGMCVFFLALGPFRRFLGVRIDPRSAVIAGGSAGLAAAFNTPLAGVTFAIEELVSDVFMGIKDYVLMAIIVAGIAAKYLYGEYAYFGRLSAPVSIPIGSAIIVGAVCGALGVLFSKALLAGHDCALRLRARPAGWLVPVALGAAVVALGWAGGRDVLGPGNEVARELAGGRFESRLYWFPAAKALATLCTFWSGVAGGIFAPSLSIGSAAGGAIARLLDAPVAACAMVGMAGFLAGAIQAPITSFVIIFEMTGRHEMLLPLMLSAMLAFIVARLAGAPRLYAALAERYRPLLAPALDTETAKG